MLFKKIFFITKIIRFYKYAGLGVCIGFIDSRDPGFVGISIMFVNFYFVIGFTNKDLSKEYLSKEIDS